MVVVVVVADKLVKRAFVVKKVGGVHLVEQGHILFGADGAQKINAYGHKLILRNKNVIILAGQKIDKAPAEHFRIFQRPCPSKNKILPGH